MVGLRRSPIYHHRVSIMNFIRWSVAQAPVLQHGYAKVLTVFEVFANSRTAAFVSIIVQYKLRWQLQMNASSIRPSNGHHFFCRSIGAFTNRLFVQRMPFCQRHHSNVSGFMQHITRNSSCFSSMKIAPCSILIPGKICAGFRGLKCTLIPRLLINCTDASNAFSVFDMLKLCTVWDLKDVTIPLHLKILISTKNAVTLSHTKKQGLPTGKRTSHIIYDKKLLKPSFPPVQT